MTSERDRAIEKILAAARALLAGERDALETAQAIAFVRLAVDPDQHDPDLLAFGSIESQTDHHLVRDSLKGWAPEVREQKEREYAEDEAFFRKGAMESAQALVERYGRAT